MLAIHPYRFCETPGCLTRSHNFSGSNLFPQAPARKVCTVHLIATLTGVCEDACLTACVLSFKKSVELGVCITCRFCCVFFEFFVKTDEIWFWCQNSVHWPVTTAPFASPLTLNPPLACCCLCRFASQASETPYVLGICETPGCLPGSSCPHSVGHCRGNMCPIWRVSLGGPAW